MVQNNSVNQSQTKKNWFYAAFFVLCYGMILFVILQVVNVDFVKGKIENIVQNYGVIGLFLIVILLDSITQPISPDIVVFNAAYLTNLDIMTIIIIAGIASGLAGVLCYTLGQKFGIRLLKKRFQQKSIDKGEKIMKKYGPFGVLVGTVTPVPYDMVCYLSGIFKVNLPSFLLIIFFGRITRFGIIALFTSSVL